MSINVTVFKEPFDHDPFYIMLECEINGIKYASIEPILIDKKTYDSDIDKIKQQFIHGIQND